MTKIFLKVASKLIANVELIRGYFQGYIKRLTMIDSDLTVIIVVSSTTIGVKTGVLILASVPWFVSI